MGSVTRYGLTQGGRPTLAKVHIGVSIIDVRSGVLERLQHFRAEPGIVSLAMTDKFKRQSAFIRRPG
ncbi:hypothetical protein SJ05684_b55750 (plasmid) [Sinorhizobium sojae CCBAU 05684]|uniref:Uncharacterized protein n=1 Tax=Sinorhizobium sojae CCBAU 05684 TaxID=716928 RepID=A0A249PLD4_9HYPH|nr:hypothetical protein SJ05684_b55750 [Sinorhizobium sojae CCBAU 05684]